jgi:hypothetical protein
MTILIFHWRKSLLGIISTLFICYNFAQNNSKTESNFNKIQLGINFSPDIAFRTLLNNHNLSENESIIEQRNQYESIKFTNSTGINFVYNFKPFVGLETGIQYSNKGYNFINKEIVAIAPQDLPEKVRFNYNYHYIDIPLKVNFIFGKKKVRFIASTGICTNLLLLETQTNTFSYADRKERGSFKTQYDYRKFNLSPTISLGLDYKINDRMNFRIEPSFRYGVIKIIESPISAHLYSAGLNLAYYFGL